MSPASELCALDLCLEICFLLYTAWQELFLSLFCMTLAKKIKGLSMAGVSVIGGVTHNIGQLIIAALVVESGSVFFYFPILLFAGTVTGLLIGIVSSEIYKRIPGRIGNDSVFKR